MTPLSKDEELRQAIETRPYTTTITREALDILCNRARIDMDWNNGDPIFREREGEEPLQIAGHPTDADIEAAKKVLG